MTRLGLHIVKKTRKGKPLRWYVYAWRGGPQIHVCNGQRPQITMEICDLASEARSKSGRSRSKLTLSGQIALYKNSTEFQGLANSTKIGYGVWLDRIDEEFGSTTLRMWESREMRGEVLEWRDKYHNKTRDADELVKVFRRLLNWIMDRGHLNANVLSRIARLYKMNRSDLIWEKQHLEAFMPVASVEVQEAADLAACTGLRRGDLVALPWVAIGDNAIVWNTSKSRGKTIVIIPLLPETRALLNRIRGRHAEEMRQRPPSRRKPLPETVLSNSHWEPWTAMGLGSRFTDAKNLSGVDRNLHDLRGTFATRCIMAGLSDQEVATILGWDTKRIAAIRARYVNDNIVIAAIAARISANAGPTVNPL